MKPFLKQLAEIHFAQEKNLGDFCFVFPNRRSGTFFRKYLQESFCGYPFIFPAITTISDFASEQSNLIETDRVELLLILYREYCCLSEHPSDFEQFLHWGDMILNDFNDVDRDLIDARELFTNVKSLKQIQADFLTPEQKSVIKDFWGIDKDIERSDTLWMKEESRESCKTLYMQLWNLLYPLYVNFRKALSSEGMGYGGMIYRLAAETVKEKSATNFEFKRIVFVGFSTLSATERQIFDKFKTLKIGDFYWDFESPFFDDWNKGSFFIRDYIKEYPSKYDLSQPAQLPNVEVHSIPSGSGQAQIVAKIVDNLIESGKITGTDSDIDTAIVLPEEKYLNAVLYSIPPKIKSLNITMGYPFSQTPVQSLISSLAILNQRKRIVNGETAYFYEDIEAIVSHPYINSICSSRISQMLQNAKDKRYFFVPISFLTESVNELSFIFNDFANDVIAYCDNILSQIYMRLSKQQENKIEQYFIDKTRQSLKQLETTLANYEIEIGEQSFFFLLSRLLSGMAVAFEGEPLRGLQIMGVLETRLLDFKNLIVLSMNEKVFPTKRYSRSFIPNNLRTGYRMATFEYQDSMYTYYFYRMISRSQNVYLLYDSRTQGTSSGEESRYIYQLDKVYNRGKNKHILYEYDVKTPETFPICVYKNDYIWNKLSEYLRPESGKFLSASSLNAYIDCPLKFYLTRVEGINEEIEMTDFIDRATFGQVVHGVFERLYAPMCGHTVTASYLDQYLAPHSPALDTVVTEALNTYYNHIDDVSRPLSGEAILIGKIVVYYVRNVILHDKRLTPFDYLASEMKTSFNWDFGDGLTVNFKLIVDRLDRVSGNLRIVDYKTGSDEIKISDDKTFSSLFEGYKRNKAILQVLLYCNAYAQATGYREAITPVIYKLRNSHTCREGKYEIINGKKAVSDYRVDIDNENFMNRIKETMHEIFNRDIPFTQTADTHSCAYCQFKEMCGRDMPDK